MSVQKPHFLLFSEGQVKNRQGQWRFVLQAADGSAIFEASDTEPGVAGERLELLAVVRGLEALDQPSHVTLFTPSKYVNRGMAYGLDEWRRNGWTWECFGNMVPVNNRDLWQRLDRALEFHRIEFQGYRVDAPHANDYGAPGPHFRRESQTLQHAQGSRLRARSPAPGIARRWRAWWRKRVALARVPLGGRHGA